MELQIFPDGLVIPSFTPILYGSSEVYRIPNAIYQTMCDLAQSTKDPKVVRKYLEEFVKDKFPDKILNAFIDLSNADIAKLKRKGICGLQWGMYIQVVDPRSMLIDRITDLLEK